MDKAEKYQKELKMVIEKQLELIRKGASVDELAENTIRFNEIADQIIADTTIYKPKRTVMLATISVYTNIFIDSLKRNRQEEERIKKLDEKIAYKVEKHIGTSSREAATNSCVPTTKIKYKDINDYQKGRK